MRASKKIERAAPENWTIFRMKSPYSRLRREAFWRTAVVGRLPSEPSNVYRAKFPITRDTRIATAGSCFAQHVGRHLKRHAFNVLDAEPLVARVSDSFANTHGFRLYSARYGNIYTVRQLLQLLREASGEFQPALPVWKKSARFYDSLRPTIDSEGHATEDGVRFHRQEHLRKVSECFQKTELLVFTFGLTESWIHRDTETVYPTAPGTIAGTYDSDTFRFHNFTYPEMFQDFLEIRKRFMASNSDVSFLITVSPVPLAATASGQHVEVASSYSKSVLRAVCGELATEFDNVDYFPSFEIITSQNARGMHWGRDQRNVTTRGVTTAMNTFLQAHDVGVSTKTRGQVSSAHIAPVGAASKQDQEDVLCEEALLEAFAPRGTD
jgi:hypothetical protein